MCACACLFGLSKLGATHVTCYSVLGKVAYSQRPGSLKLYFSGVIHQMILFLQHRRAIWGMETPSKTKKNICQCILKVWKNINIKSNKSNNTSMQLNFKWTGFKPKYSSPVGNIHFIITKIRNRLICYRNTSQSLSTDNIHRTLRILPHEKRRTLRSRT